MYDLFALTSEERDLWVNGLSRILKIEVMDPGFVPTGHLTRAKLIQQDIDKRN